MKYSKQRSLILESVKMSREHPSADMIYSTLKDSVPGLSLGTVYRNLSVLAENGLIQKIPVPNGKDRFDGRCDMHCHGICLNCSRVVDIEAASDSSFRNLLGNIQGFTCLQCHVLIEGYCTECAALMKRKEEKVS